MQLQLTPKDLNFVGYTYKNFDALKGLRQAFGKQLLLPSYDDWSLLTICFLMVWGRIFETHKSIFCYIFFVWLVIILLLLERSFLAHLYLHHLNVCLFLSITLYTVLKKCKIWFSVLDFAYSWQWYYFQVTLVLAMNLSFICI